MSEDDQLLLDTVVCDHLRLGRSTVQYEAFIREHCGQPMRADGAD